MAGVLLYDWKKGRVEMGRLGETMGDFARYGAMVVLLLLGVPQVLGGLVCIFLALASLGNDSKTAWDLGSVGSLALVIGFAMCFAAWHLRHTPEPKLSAPEEACSYCGARLKGNAKSCRWCGADQP